MSPSRDSAQSAGISATLEATKAEGLTFAPRSIRVLRAAVLIVTGLVVTFSAELHENVAFDTALVVAALALIGVVHGIEAFARRKSGGVAEAILLAIVSLAAAVVVSATVFGTGATFATTALALTLAAWALVSALLEFLGMVVHPGTRQDAALVGAAGVLLAIFLLLFRDDAVAVIGFFGGYAVLAGVFLGIGAFDTRRGSRKTAPTAQPSIHPGESTR